MSKRPAARATAKLGEAGELGGAGGIDWSRRPRCRALAAGGIAFGAALRRELAGCFKAAYGGRAPRLHETLLVAGYYHRRSSNPVVIADQLGVSLATFNRLRHHPDFRWPLETDFRDSWIDVGWVAVFADAHDGHFPEMDRLIVGAGYRCDGTVATQAELAERLDVDERTIQRWVAKGMPVVRDANGQRYNVAAAIHWEVGMERHTYALPGAQIAAYVAELVERRARQLDGGTRDHDDDDAGGLDDEGHGADADELDEVPR